MLYDVSVIGDCVQDFFILARSKLINDGKSKYKEFKYLSYPYGDKLNVNELHFDLGGSACNAAVAIRKLNYKTTIASMLGDDIYSRGLLQEIKKKKVGTSFLYKEKNKDLGLSFILLGPDRDRTILTYRTNNNFKKINLRKLFWLSKSFYIAGINKYSKIILMDILQYCIKKNKKIYINPSIYQIEHDLPMLKKILKHTEVVVMNVEEAKGILNARNKTTIKQLLKKVYKLGPKSVVITDGIKGSYAYDGGKFVKAGIYPSKRLDTTGAGDSFCSTFVATQMKGYNIEESLHFATINAANVVSVYGAQKGLLGEKEIISRYNRNRVRVKKI